MGSGESLKQRFTFWTRYTGDRLRTRSQRVAHPMPKKDFTFVSPSSTASGRVVNGYNVRNRCGRAAQSRLRLARERPAGEPALPDA